MVIGIYKYSESVVLFSLCQKKNAFLSESEINYYSCEFNIS